MDLQIENIKNINNKQTDHLTSILNTDKKLQKSLGDTNKVISNFEFIEFNGKWARRNNAEIFAITLDKKAIGLISLSKISKQDGTANIGYWIASKYWGKGYTTQAFEKIVKLAKEKGLKSLSSSIDKANMQSIAIWRKLGAVFKNKKDKVIPSLYL